MNKLVKALKLLDVINEQDIEILNSVQILDQKIKNTKYTFTILLSAPLPIALFKKISNVQYDDIQIEVKVVAVKKITHNDVKQYLESIVDAHPELKLFAKHVALDHFSYSHEEHLITFKYAIENELNEIHQVVKSIVDLLKSAFGLPLLDFTTEVDNDFKERISSKKELKEKQIAEIIENHKQQSVVENNVKEMKVDIKKSVGLNELLDGMKNVSLTGEVYNVEYKETNKIESYKFYINDYTTTFIVKYVIFKENSYNSSTVKKLDNAIFKDIQIGDWVYAVVDVKTDKFEPELYGQIKKITKTKKPQTLLHKDDEQDKRIELTAHSKMSAFDGVIEVDDLAKTIKELGYSALPITDRYNIQSFPNIQKQAKNYKLKPIYGCEFCTLNHPQSVLNGQHIELKRLSYVVFDLETTGLNPKYDDIIEFGGIKYVDGIMSETLQFFIKPRNPITDFTTELTGITQQDVEHAINQEQGIMKILNFIGDMAVIAHNGINFDFNFLTSKAEKYLARTLSNTVIDTLHIVRGLYPNWKSHTLEKTCKEFKVKYEVGAAHRADYDANVLNACWTKLLDDFTNLNIIYLDEINLKITSQRLHAMYQSDHTFVYVKNSVGLKKLNELISIAHTAHFYNIPRLPRQILDANRQDLIIAPSPVEGEVMRVALSGTDLELKKAIAKYDYIFIAPLDCFLPYTKTKEITEEALRDATLRIIRFAMPLNRKVVAVSNTYYLNQWDKKYQEVYLYAKALNGRRHRYYRYKMLPNQHLRTTKEMYQAFSFLEDEKLIKEIVVSNTHLFAGEISDDIFPIKDRLFAPKMKDVNEKLTTVVYETAKKIYGDKLPIQVTERLERELNSIIKHEFSVVYWVSHLLVKKSNEDGYPVGSRGSVGSSLVATMLQITDVNPLAPHYLCDKCKYCHFEENIDDGFDLVPIKCPQCGGLLRGEGHTIPFETFLGFKGDKTPDIDLNFSGVYQPVAHNFIKEIFGADHSFRAGTISTVAEKTCYSLVKSYFDEIGRFDAKLSELNLYVNKCQNVKRTTGQHPGGILVIPSEYSVFDFTPYNFPADDTTSDWFTTHYAFEFLHDNLLKFDILGHDNPTILKRLKDLTGIDEKDVPTYDPKVLKLFTSIEPLNLDDEYLLDEKNGAISIPEFGTKFVREMLVDTQPSSFADLIRISGLSHGTNVYLGNAKDLIKHKDLKLMNVIACRDDIMIYLIQKGLDPSMSFKIMEDVRKGKKLKSEYVDAMKSKNVPNWYIDSCNKIEYIFPKAHAAAYVMHAWKFAWYKIYYPLQYYSLFFSTKADSFEIETIVKGKHAIKNRMAQIKLLMDNKETAAQVKKKEIDSLTIFEVCLELLSRNFKIAKPDIFMSDATEFVIDKDTLIMPFNCIDGIGDDVAKQLVETRNEKPFRSLDDVISRTKLNRTSIAKLEELGTFDSLPKSDQLSLF